MAESGLYRETLMCRFFLHRKVNSRLPGKGNSNSLGARPVYIIITMMKWIRTSRLSIKNSLFDERGHNLPGPRRF